MWVIRKDEPRPVLNRLLRVFKDTHQVQLTIQLPVSLQPDVKQKTELKLLYPTEEEKQSKVNSLCALLEKKEAFESKPDVFTGNGLYVDICSTSCSSRRVLMSVLPLLRYKTDVCKMKLETGRLCFVLPSDGSQPNDTSIVKDDTLSASQHQPSSSSSVCSTAKHSTEPVSSVTAIVVYTINNVALDCNGQNLILRDKKTVVRRNDAAPLFTDSALRSVDVVAIGCSDGRIALYATEHPQTVFTPAENVSTFTTLNSSSLQFRLVATRQITAMQEASENPEITTLALALSSNSGNENNDVTMLITSGTSDGRFFMWTVYNPLSVLLTDGPPCSILPFFGGESPGVKSSVTTSAFVHIETVSPPKAPCFLLTTTAIVAWASGDVFQAVVSATPVLSHAIPTDSTSSPFRSWKKTSSQRRRLWQPDALLGAVISVEVQSVTPFYCAQDYTKIAVFRCARGIVALQVYPSLQLIFRHLIPSVSATPNDVLHPSAGQLPNCSFCFLHPLELLQCSSNPNVEMHNLPSWLPVQSILMSCRRTEDSNGSPVQQAALQHMSFYRDTSTMQWDAVWSTLFICPSEVLEKSEQLTPPSGDCCGKNGQALPYFLCMMYVSDVRVFIAVDEKQHVWLASPTLVLGKPSLSSNKNLQFTLLFKKKVCINTEPLMMRSFSVPNVFCAAVRLNKTSLALVLPCNMAIKLSDCACEEVQDLWLNHIRTIATAEDTQPATNPSFLNFDLIDTLLLSLQMPNVCDGESTLAGSSATTETLPQTPLDDKCVNKRESNALLQNFLTHSGNFCSTLLTEFLHIIQAEHLSVTTLHSLLVAIQRDYHEHFSMVSGPSVVTSPAVSCCHPTPYQYDAANSCFLSGERQDRCSSQDSDAEVQLRNTSAEVSLGDSSTAISLRQNAMEISRCDSCSYDPVFLPTKDRATKTSSIALSSPMRPLKNVESNTSAISLCKDTREFCFTTLTQCFAERETRCSWTPTCAPQMYHCFLNFLSASVIITTVVAILDASSFYQADAEHVALPAVLLIMLSRILNCLPSPSPTSPQASFICSHFNRACQAFLDSSVPLRQLLQDQLDALKSDDDDEDATHDDGQQHCMEKKNLFNERRCECQQTSVSRSVMSELKSDAVDVLCETLCGALLVLHCEPKKSNTCLPLLIKCVESNVAVEMLPEFIAYFFWLHREHPQIVAEEHQAILKLLPSLFATHGDVALDALVRLLLCPIRLLSEAAAIEAKTLLKLCAEREQLFYNELVLWALLLCNKEREVPEDWTHRFAQLLLALNINAEEELVLIQLFTDTIPSQKRSQLLFASTSFFYQQQQQQLETSIPYPRFLLVLGLMERRILEVLDLLKACFLKSLSTRCSTSPVLDQSAFESSLYPTFTALCDFFTQHIAQFPLSFSCAYLASLFLSLHCRSVCGSETKCCSIWFSYVYPDVLYKRLPFNLCFLSLSFAIHTATAAETLCDDASQSPALLRDNTSSHTALKRFSDALLPTTPMGQHHTLLTSAVEALSFYEQLLFVNLCICKHTALQLWDEVFCEKSYGDAGNANKATTTLESVRKSWVLYAVTVFPESSEAIFPPRCATTTAKPPQQTVFEDKLRAPPEVIPTRESPVFSVPETRSIGNDVKQHSVAVLPADSEHVTAALKLLKEPSTNEMLTVNEQEAIAPWKPRWLTNAPLDCEDKAQGYYISVLAAGVSASSSSSSSFNTEI